MEIIISEFITNYGATIIYSLLGGIFTWIGANIQKLVKNHFNEKTKREVVDTVVQAVQQLYEEYSNEEKLEKAIEACFEMFAQKEIPVTDLELRLLIEAAITKFKGNFNSPEKKKKMR